MILEVETITPNDAAAWLRKSEGQLQRTLSELLVNRLTAAIEAGEWRLTHQGIAIDDAGVVLDGQHRLHAIVRADRAVPMLVARGVDPAGFSVFDTGRARTTADSLRVAGYANGPAIASAARYLLAYDEVVGTTTTLRSRTRLLSTVHVLELLDSDRGATLLQAVAAADRVAGRGLSRVGFRTWLAPVIVAMHEGPPDDSLALEFLERLHDGASLPPGSPILALRRFLMSDGGLIRHQAGLRADVGMGVTIKAFNSWNAHADRQLAVFRAGVEPMPRVEAVMPGGFLAN